MTYEHNFSPPIQAFIDAYTDAAGKAPTSRMIAISMNEFLNPKKPSEFTPASLAAKFAVDPVLVGYWTDEKLGMSGLLRSGDDFIVRVDPTDRIQDFQDIDLFVPSHGAVLAKEKVYIGNLIVDSDVYGARAHYRIAGINPMAVMNRLIRQARLLGLTDRAA